MRGSAWVYIRIWLVNRDSTINKRSVRKVYGYSDVRDLNTSYQQQYQLEKALNKAIGLYRREEVDVASDTEINYQLLNSGIQIKREGKPIQRKKFTRLTPSQKRKSHREVIGKPFRLTIKQMNKEFVNKPVDIQPQQFKEKTQKEYEEDKKFQKALKKSQTFSSK